MSYLEAASSMPNSLRYMDRELSKYLPKDADFHQTALGEKYSCTPFPCFKSLSGLFLLTLR